MDSYRRHSIWMLVLLGLIFLFIFLLVRNQAHRDDTGQNVRTIAEIHPMEETNLVAYPGRTFSYPEKFNDLQSRQLAVAEQIGLSPRPATREAARKMGKNLRMIRTNKLYAVDELTHSVPYLIPIAAARLDSIGAEFQDILQRNGLPLYRFYVTSVLRTDEDVRSLRRSGNGNAVENSAHNYGTTFDIAYTRFEKLTSTHDYMTEENLKLALAQVLLNQQRAGHIFVKYERKQACFHITVRD